MGGYENSPMHERVQAIWMLLRPVIESKAQELGASPMEMALALTIGAPTYLFAAAPGDTVHTLESGKALFSAACDSLINIGGK
jgi:hypothetical protein